MGQLRPRSGNQEARYSYRFGSQTQLQENSWRSHWKIWKREESLHMTTRSTLLRNDNFIETVVSSANREVYELSEEHIIFNGPDPQILIHIWRKDGFYFGGTSERSYRPRGDIRTNDLIPIKQWLVMELFDFLRLSWNLKDIGIAFRWLSPAPGWSQDPESWELLHEGSPTGILADDSAYVAANLHWFMKHSPERLFEIAHIESTKEVCQALFGTPRVPFA